MNQRDTGQRWLFRHTVIVTAIALAVRLVVLVAGPGQDVGRAVREDSSRYVQLAQTLRTYGSFGKAHEEGVVHRSLERLAAANGTLPPPDAHGLRPEFLRTPAYPALIALVGALGGGLRGALLAQCIIGALAAGAAVKVALAFGLTPYAARLVGFACALHPALLVYDNLLMTESVFASCGTFALVLASGSRTLPGAVLAGLAIGVATLVRPIGFLYLPAAVVLVPNGRHGRLVTLATLTCVAAVLPAAWALRNQAAGGGLRLSTIGDVNLLYYVTAYSISEERHEDWQGTWLARVEELTKRVEADGAPGKPVVDTVRHVAMEELRMRPVAAARMMVKSSAKLFVDHSMPDVMGLLGRSYVGSGLFARAILGEAGATRGLGWQPLAGFAWMLANAMIALLALAGTALAIRRRDVRLLAGCVMPVALFALASAGVGLERTRVPCLLFLFILAASVVHDRRRRASPP